MEYSIWVPEVWYQRVEIEADSPEEALKLVQDGGGYYVDNALDYSHTLEDGWDVQER